MALYCYFKRHSDDKLPDPRGLLSIKIPSTSITSANVEVRHVVNQEPASRGPYAKFTAEPQIVSFTILSLAEQRAVIGKRAAEHGVAATIHFYAKEFPNLKESSVCSWKSTYTSEIIVPPRRRNMEQIDEIL